MSGMKIIHQMSKNQLNHYFTKNYDNISLYGIKAIKKLKRNIDISWLMSECYLYLYESINELNSERDVVSWSKNWIKTNLKWTTTPLMRQTKMKGITDTGELPHYIESDNYITDELMINFKDTLSTYDKRLFNIWWDLDLRKGKDIAEYLNISMTGAYNIIKECKEIDFRLEKYIRKNII